MSSNPGGQINSTQLSGMMSILKRWSEDRALPVVIGGSLTVIFILMIVGARVFPVNDGGFWFAFSRKLIEKDFQLPLSLVFNTHNVPLAYPPLAAYLIAFVHSITGLPIELLLIWLPAVLCVVNFCLFARLSYRYFGFSGTYKAAILVYPILIYSYRWFIMGGGVSRGLGQMFMLIAWIKALELRDGDPRRFVPLLPIAMSLAVLSHPRGALWAIMGTLVLLLNRASMRALIIHCGAAVCITLPWAILVLYRHGIHVYLNAFSTGGHSLDRFILLPDHLGVTAFQIGCSFLGLFLLLERRAWELPVIWLLGMVFDPQGAGIQNGVVLHAIFAAVALCAGVQFLFKSQSKGPLLAVLFLGAIIVYELAAYAMLLKSTRSYLTEPQTEEIRDLERLGNSLTPGVSLVLMSRHSTAGDALGEWLATFSPVFVENTHQMTEWRGGFRDILARHYSSIETCCNGEYNDCLRVPELWRSNLFVVHRRSCPTFELVLKERSKCTYGWQSDAFSVVRCEPGWQLVNTRPLVSSP